MLINIPTRSAGIREPSPLVCQAQLAASRAANVAAVRVVDETSMQRHRDIADLLIRVWGTSQHGPPIPADLLRSIGHAGCNVTAAYNREGLLCGAAAAIVSPDVPSMYSLIAGVLPGLGDAGVGFALKQHQRAWALTRGLTTMTWTFDPLVSRNARFNLTKLGAHASEYVENFYGEMDDEINAHDESDRLVALWLLESPETLVCSEGTPALVELPDFTADAVCGTGPDGQPVLVELGHDLWCRVPTDIVALRAEDPVLAAAWRTGTRAIFQNAFSEGYTATAMTRTGWYLLQPSEHKGHHE
ncbi:MULTISPECIES: chorismate synthase [unclassified Cryobacterium]|uniref:chorismate synthase n=1 Tax=unclassified Cryobacterium TaxID=2649013 RepID=UPI000CE4B2BD|nr:MULTISPECIES: chorismate synthase [unclassified Cryobacterium]